MTDKQDWHCSKITDCGKEEQCPAGADSDKACWEIAVELEDYRSGMNICQDCLVYLAQKENSILSDDEIKEILEKKGVCILIDKCLNKDDVSD